MKILAVDTATRIAGASVLDDGIVLAESWMNTGRTHSQKFMPLLAGMLKNLDLTAAEMDCFAVTVGPGSFTGLRIGIATVQGLILATGKPAVSVVTLDALAENMPGYAGLVCPILDARKVEVYTAFYRWQAGRMVCLGDYRAMSPAELADQIKKQAEPAVFLGDGVLRYQPLLAELLAEQADFAKGTGNFLRPSTVALLGLEKYRRGETTDGAGIKPVYLRASEAEVKWVQKHGGSIDD